MIILVDNNNLITSFAIQGGLENGVEVDDSNLPSDFVASFKPQKFKLIDGIISYNKEYDDNSKDELKSLNQSLEDKVKTLEERITELENLLTPSE